MRLALLAILPLILMTPVAVGAQRARNAQTERPTATTTVTITVTDQSGAALPDVRVMLIGGLDRSGSTQTNGVVRFDGLRPGSYRLRFAKDGFVLLEREFDWRPGEAAPNPSVALTPGSTTQLTSAGESNPSSIPPPGKPLSLAVPDFIEKNFIANSQPQKVSPVGCSGLAQTVLWQIREPWENRQHAGADAMLYIIGGEGTVRLDGRDQQIAAGSFAQVPRGSTYNLTRRGRNPLIILATLAGEPCQ